jgi:hypothetical protein
LHVLLAAAMYAMALLFKRPLWQCCCCVFLLDC